MFYILIGVIALASWIVSNTLQRKFKKLHTELQKIQNKPFQKRAFLYLDIISWLEAKMNHTSVQEVISAKFAARKPH